MARLLAIVNASAEGLAAARYAARRAAAQDRVLVLAAVVAPPPFVQWGAVQEALAAEAKTHTAEELARVVEHLKSEAALLGGWPPRIETRLLVGEAAPAILALAGEMEGLDGLVLPISPGDQQALVGELAVARAAELPCPLVLVPAAAQV